MTDRDMFIDIKRRLDGIETRLDTLEALIDRARTLSTPPTPQYRLTDDAFFDMATRGGDPFRDSPTRTPESPDWRLDNPLQPLAIIAAAALIGWALWSALT